MKSRIIAFSTLLAALFMAYCVYHITQKNKPNVVKFEVSEKDNSSENFPYDVQNYETQLLKIYKVPYNNFPIVNDSSISYRKQNEDIIYEKLKRWDSKTDPIFKLTVSTNELEWLYYGTAREIDSIKCILKDSILICSVRVREVENARIIAEEKEKRDLEMKLEALAKKVGETCK